MDTYLLGESMGLTPPPAVMPDECSGCGKSIEEALLTFARGGNPYGDHLGLDGDEFVQLCGECEREVEDLPTGEPREQLTVHSIPEWREKSKQAQQEFMEELVADAAEQDES